MRFDDAEKREGGTLFGLVRSTRLALMASLFVSVLTASAVVSGASGASAAGPQSLHIGHVTISGTEVGGVLVHPSFVVTGGGFGSKPPVSNPRPCGYSGNDYGPVFEFQDITANWFAGGNNGAANCVGLAHLVWQAHRLTFKFGKAYGRSSAPIYWLTPGDAYTVNVNGAVFTGNVP
jgi:hypothetical protein